MLTSDLYNTRAAQVEMGEFLRNPDGGDHNFVKTLTNEYGTLQSAGGAASLDAS